MSWTRNVDWYAYQQQRRARGVCLRHPSVKCAPFTFCFACRVKIAAYKRLRRAQGKAA